MKASDLNKKVSYKVSDFKENTFESIDTFKKWIRSPKTSKRGMPISVGDHYENLIYYFDKPLLEASNSNHNSVQTARIVSSKLKNLDKREQVEIKVGNKISVLSLGLIPADNFNRIELSGFVTPKKIVKIHTDVDNKIESIEFDDGSMFPEASEFTTVKGINITNALFFPNQTSASHAHTKIWMIITQLEGQGWKLENHISEGKNKKKRTSKIKKALYGPGPYGMYGTDAGYSGLAESLTPEKADRIKEFVKFCFKKLQLKKRPRIRLTNRVETTALGYFVPDTNTIVVVVKGRHSMDIMRTLAHELVHLKQSESRELDGSTGSPDENEANAMAGVLLRVWGKLHPEYFVEQRKFTDLEIAIMEGGGSIDDDCTYTIRKQLEQAWKEKKMRISEIIESATAGATSTANIGTVVNPHHSPGPSRGKKSYLGSPWGGKSGTKAPPQPKVVQPKNPDGTAKSAHDIKGASLFGGPAIKR